MSFRFKVPHTLVLLFIMIVIAYALTWMLPAGTFEMVTNDHNREVVVPGTYTLLEGVARLPIWSIVTVIPRGLEAAQGIIFFVFLIGGSLAVIRTTGSIDAALARLLRRFGNRPAWLIFIGMLVVAIGASTIGMSEEFIPLTVVLLTLCVGMRMDAITAAGILVIGSGIGYGVAALNPFTVLVAQEVAGVPLISGIEYRLAISLPFFLIGFFHMWRYAKKIRSNPAASLVHDVPEAQLPEEEATVELSGRHVTILWITIATLILLVWGIISHGWYFVELGAVFVVLAVVVGLVAGLPLDKIARSFTAGAAELTGTALLIGFARAIELILTDGQVMHTIVNGLATPLENAGAEIAASGMLVIQSVFNFFIPSGSGQAYVTMPLMAPIADIVGVSRQVAVLAYQMGDGFMNMIIPTGPVLMGILGIAGIPYGRWFKFIWPLAVQLVIAGSVALIIATWIGYQ
ncbi:MAG: TIGR00366 family protein [Bacteroidota bacterium]